MPPTPRAACDAADQAARRASLPGTATVRRAANRLHMQRRRRQPQPERSLNPAAIDPRTGCVFVCKFCGARLLETEASSTRQTKCCMNGALLHVTVPQPPAGWMESVVRDPKWPELCRAVNWACMMACIWVRRDLDKGGGFHMRGPYVLRLEGTVMFYEQTADLLSSEHAVDSLMQASKLWWLTNTRLPEHCEDDLRRLVLKVRQMIVDIRGEDMPVLPANVFADTLNAPDLELDFERPPMIEEVIAVHDATECEPPPAPEYGTCATPESAHPVLPAERTHRRAAARRARQDGVSDAVAARRPAAVRPHHQPR